MTEQQAYGQACSQDNKHLVLRQPQAIKCQLHEDEQKFTTCHQRGLKCLSMKGVSLEFLDFTFRGQSK